MTGDLLGARELSLRFGIPLATVKRRLADLEARYGDRYVVRRGPKGRNRALLAQHVAMVSNGSEWLTKAAKSDRLNQVEKSILAIAADVAELKTKLRARGFSV